MKKLIFPSLAVALLFVAITAFRPAEKAEIPEFYAQDFQYVLENEALAERFETQFAHFVGEVDQIAVHYNDFAGYYYTVYGHSKRGEALVDFFKTTEEEVQAERYNYIEMTERTMAAGRKVCREATVFPPPSGNFCDANNNGYICGFEVWPNVCFLY